MLDHLVNKYNNTYHCTFKVKPIDVKSIAYILTFIKKIKKIRKFKFGDHVKISKYKIIFSKGYTSN